MLPSGAELFARYAYPPNELGYCGPDDPSVLLRRDAAAGADIARHARQFEGAWAYLELIAQAAGVADPLDPRVVEAYWIGNDLLDLLDPEEVARELQVRLPRQPGASYFAGQAHHGYQVFAVYPWVGILARNPDAAQALTILERCRIRWGEVRSIDGDDAVVESRGLVLGEGVLGFGPVTESRSAVARRGRSVLATGGSGRKTLAPGDVVAMHWGWVCDVLSGEQVAQLERHTADTVAGANEVLTRARHAGAR